MSAYPVAYRRSTGGRGFQVPTASNDNRRTPVLQLASKKLFANDSRKRKTVFGKKLPFQARSLSLAKTAGRSLVGNTFKRLFPYSGLIGVVSELLLSDYAQINQKWKLNSYKVILDCGGGNTLSEILLTSCLLTELPNWLNPPHGTPATNLGIWADRGHIDGFNRSIAKFGTQLQGTGTRPYTYPQNQPGYLPRVQEIPDFGLDPLSIPIGQPMPVPVPLPLWAVPYRQINPWRSPSEQPQRGPIAKPLPRSKPSHRPLVRPVPRTPKKPGPSPRPQPDPLDKPITRVGPTAPPAVELDFGTGSPLAVKPQHKRQRPPKRTKERKVVISNPASGIINIVTESGDFLDALYWALPQSVRRKYRRNVYGRMTAVYQNITSIDIQLAIKNLIINEIGDRLIGTLAQGLKKSHRTNYFKGLQPNSPFGFGSGPAL